MIRRRVLKDRQHNGKEKMNEQTNNDLKNEPTSLTRMSLISREV